MGFSGMEFNWYLVEKGTKLKERISFSDEKLLDLPEEEVNRLFSLPTEELKQEVEYVYVQYVIEKTGFRIYPMGHELPVIVNNECVGLGKVQEVTWLNTVPESFTGVTFDLIEATDEVKAFYTEQWQAKQNATLEEAFDKAGYPKGETKDE